MPLGVHGRPWSPCCVSGYLFRRPLSGHPALLVLVRPLAQSFLSFAFLSVSCIPMPLRSCSFQRPHCPPSVVSSLSVSVHRRWARFPSSLRGSFMPSELLGSCCACGSTLTAKYLCIDLAALVHSQARCIAALLQGDAGRRWATLAAMGDDPCSTPTQ